MKGRRATAGKTYDDQTILEKKEEKETRKKKRIKDKKRLGRGKKIRGKTNKTRGGIPEPSDVRKLKSRSKEKKGSQGGEENDPRETAGTTSKKKCR